MSLLSFVVGVVLLIITFFFTWLIVGVSLFGLAVFSELAFGKPLKMSPDWEPVICGFFLVLLFVENCRTNREYLSCFVLQHKVVPAGGLLGALISLLANSDATGKIVADTLFTGPRVVTYSILTLHRMFRLMKTDRETASATLAILVRRLHRMPLNELSIKLFGRDPMETLLLLQELDCILFLSKEPAGTILTEKTRKELNHLLGSKIDCKPAPAEEPMATRASEDLDYYELLGLQPGASLADIKAAYRSRIKQCHPDKFIGRGADFHQLAEERAKALNEAYEILSAKHQNCCQAEPSAY